MSQNTPDGESHAPLECHRLLTTLSLASIVTAALTGLVAPIRAHADMLGDFQVTVGAKLWENEWISWYPVQTGHNTNRVVESVSSDYESTVIPQVSVRYSNVQLSASYFTSTDYTLNGFIDPVSGAPGALKASRKEWDSTLAYYVLPSLAITAGYKQIEQDFGQTSYKWSGATLGASGSAALRDRLALYGSFVYGWPRLHASVVDDAGNDSYSGTYLLGEVGLAYVAARRGNFVLTVTAGYRAQTVKTRDYAVSTGFGGYATVDVHDTTQGPTLGILLRF